MRLLGSSAGRLRQAFHDGRILTLPQVKTRLGTSAAMTVFRHLKPLGYLTSYSHRGRYYTLPALAEFDERGLSGANDVWVSREGTLVRTSAAWVNRATEGFYADELRAVSLASSHRAQGRLYSFVAPDAPGKACGPSKVVNARGLKR